MAFIVFSAASTKTSAWNLIFLSSRNGGFLEVRIERISVVICVKWRRINHNLHIEVGVFDGNNVL